MAGRRAARTKRNWHGYLNIGTIVFLLIIVYLACVFMLYMSKSKRAIYEVSQSAISDTIKGTGIILREEEVVYTEEEGFLTSYLADGDRVKNNGTVYTIDKTGRLQNEINHFLEENNKLGATEKSKIFDDLRSFTEGYKDDDFYMVSEAKNEISHDLLSYTGVLLSNNKKELEKKYGKNCYIEVKSTSSGLVSYSSDGLEDLKKKDITKKVFDDKVYMKDLRTGEKAKAGTPVYRLTTSQKWRLILPLSEEDYARMKDLEEKDIHNVHITVEKDEFDVTVPFVCYEEDGQGYLELRFQNYVQRYLNQRYLSIEILLVQGSGLKIPASALVEKEVFRIPVEYLSKGSNSETNNHVNLIYIDKKGQEKTKQVKVKIFDELEANEEAGTEASVIVLSTDLAEGDRIRHPEEATTFALDKTVTAYGVYSVNSGYAIFSYVDISERNEDYCIINKNRSDIELYDRIILNSNTIKENEIIY